MQMPDLERIIMMRKSLGLTQTELAKRAGTSQSLIARIEAGSVDPRYSKVVKIFTALDIGKKKGITAKEIMTTDVVNVQTVDTMRTAVNKMKKHNVSQLPVLEGRNQRGSISEGVIMNQISKGGNIAAISERKVGEYMEEPLPQVNPDTNIGTLSSLLEHSKAVLVTDKGTIRGIVTKADLLKVVRA